MKSWNERVCEYEIPVGAFLKYTKQLCNMYDDIGCFFADTYADAA